MSGAGQVVGRVVARALRPVFAVGAGGLLFLGFPPRSAWWLAPVAFALLGAVLAGRRARAGAGLGFLFGLGYFVPLLSWTGEFVGPLPWLALAVLQAGFVALAGAGIAVVSALRWWPVAAAAVWVAAEAARARVPFGGFPWGRVAFGQPDGAYTPLVAVGSTALVGFAVTLTGFAVAAAVLAWRRSGQRRLPVLALVGLAALPLLAGPVAGVLVGPPSVDGWTTVAAIQGNVPRLGLDFNAQRRAVLDNHVRRTEQLAADVAAGRAPAPDLVIWPENSADIDPLRNPDARAAVDRATAAIGVPVLVGAVLSRPDGTRTNTLIVWDPVTGPGEEHDKRRLQPFGEYMPYREFFRLFSSLVDRSSDFTPGTGDGAVDLNGVRVGVATCYEVIFDDAVRESITSGATLLAVPSNNATFGLTEMTYQQLAVTRVRAVEFGRTAVVAVTSGVSALVGPDGSVQASTGQFTADALVARVPLSQARTPALWLGGPVEVALVALALVATGLGVWRRRAGRRAAAADPAGPGPAAGPDVDPAGVDPAGELGEPPVVADARTGGDGGR